MLITYLLQVVVLVEVTGAVVAEQVVIELLLVVRQYL
jgi:hypothetical protein